MDAFVTPTALGGSLRLSRAPGLRHTLCISHNHHPRKPRIAATLAPPQQVPKRVRSLKTAPPPSVRPPTVPLRVFNPVVEPEVPEAPEESGVPEGEDEAQQESATRQLKPVFTISELQKDRVQRAAVMARRGAYFMPPAVTAEESVRAKSTLKSARRTAPCEVGNEVENQEIAARARETVGKNLVGLSGASDLSKEGKDMSRLNAQSTPPKLHLVGGGDVYKSELCKKLDKLSLSTKTKAHRKNDVLRERTIGLHYEMHEDLVQDVLALRGDLIENEQGRIVVYRGNPRANLMVIGEAPGAQEDKEGLPFVGAAGQLLNRVLRYAGFDVEQDVYVTNVVKRRPRGNRDPTPAEIAYYLPILQEEMRLVNPGIVMLAGRFAMKSILPDLASILKARGRWFTLPGGSMAMPVLHPSYLLRRIESKELMRADVLQIRSRYLELYPDAQLADVTNQGSNDTHR